MKSPLAALLGALLSLNAGPALAEKADRDKPMNVESDALHYDDLKQVSVFTGHVVLTKGTIVIRGERVEVRQDAEGFQFGVVTAAPGQLAFFRQKRDGVDEYIEGEGQTIDYDGRADTVKFIKTAILRRLRGAALADEVTGDTIQYDNTTDVLTVDAGPARADGGRGRVRAMLTPKPKDAASAPAGAAPALRPAGRLDGPK